MSVLVKGMKMPRNCLMCQFHGFGGYKNEFIVCSLTGRSEGQLSNVPDCPLVEVPFPHGRLIDGDNVIKLLREQLTGDRDTVYEYYDDGLEMAISELSIIPTIIEAEEGLDDNA